MKTGLKIILIPNCYECPNSRYVKLENKSNKICAITGNITSDYDADFYLEEHPDYYEKCSEINYFPIDCPLEVWNGDRKVRFLLIDHCLQCNLLCVNGVDGDDRLFCMDHHEAINEYNILSGKYFHEKCSLEDYEI